MPRGGARPGGGRPKGSKNKNGPARAIEKEVLRERLRAKVAEELEPMVAAQVAAAKGIQYLVARQKKGGKFVHLTKELAEGILSGAEQDYEAIEVWEKLPSTPAFTDLLNRTMDKPTETIQATVTVEGLDARIRAAKKRVSGVSS